MSRRQSPLLLRSRKKSRARLLRGIWRFKGYAAWPRYLSYFFTHQSIPAVNSVSLVGRQLSTVGSVLSASPSFSRSPACLCPTLSNGVTLGGSLHIGSSEYIHCTSLP